MRWECSFYGRYMQNMQRFEFSVIIFMYIIRCNDQIIGNIGSTVDSDEAGTAAETAEGGDSISTAYVGRRWYTSWSKTNAAMMTSRARAGEQQLVSSSSILSIAATTTSADGTVTSQDDLNGAPVPNSDEAQWWRQWRQLSLQHECERLQTLVDSHTRKKTNGNGTGKNNKRCLWLIQQTCPIRRHWWAAQRTPFGRHTSFCSFVGDGMCMIQYVHMLLLHMWWIMFSYLNHSLDMKIFTTKASPCPQFLRS